MKTYSSTITSKGTVTLPANLRHKLGLNTGGKVTITLSGNNFIIKPQGSWNDFFATRDKIATKSPEKFIARKDLAT